MVNKERSQHLQKLRADCQNCCGLCCVALHFANSEGFPEDKVSGCACSKLTDTFQCRIHAELKQREMKGCIGYDCYGAGQRVTQSVYNGHSWSEHCVSATEMYTVFQHMFQLYQIRFFLLEALFIDVSSNVLDELQRYLVINEEICNTEPSVISTFSIAEYQNHVNTILKRICKAQCKGKIDDNIYAYMGRSYKGNDFSYYDFSMKLLLAANFTNCIFNGAVFLGADTRDADFSNADLRQALFLSQGQVNRAKGNINTKLPAHLQRPVTWI